VRADSTVRALQNISEQVFCGQQKLFGGRVAEQLDLITRTKRGPWRDLKSPDTDSQKALIDTTSWRARIRCIVLHIWHPALWPLTASDDQSVSQLFDFYDTLPHGRNLLPVILGRDLRKHLIGTA